MDRREAQAALYQALCAGGAPPPGEQWTALADNFRLRKLRKGVFFLRSGESTASIAFLPWSSRSPHPAKSIDSHEPIIKGRTVMLRDWLGLSEGRGTRRNHPGVMILWLKPRVRDT